MNRYKYLSGIPLLLLLLLLGSCGKAYKKVAYFKNVPDTLQGPAYVAALSNNFDITVQTDDILQISVQTIDPQSNTLMGTTNDLSYLTQAAPSGIGGSGPVQGGYLVDKSGYIDMPLTGRIKVAGLTTEQVKDAVRKQAQIYYKEPVVNVRFANFKITVLGEVARPSTYTVPNEQVNLLDALGMAGDLTIFGKRDNVLLVRTENNKKVFVRFNLNSTDIYQSPYLQLRQGDLIYVEPAKSKAVTTDVSRARTFSLIAAGTSLLLILISRTSF